MLHGAVLQPGMWLVFFFPPGFPGLPISVLVNCTGLRPPGRLREIELFNTSGHVLLSLPVQPLLNSSSGSTAQLWVGSPLWAPPGDFLLKVKGEDAQGHPLHRLSGVTYTSIVPGELNPRVLSRDRDSSTASALVSPWSSCVPRQLPVSFQRFCTSARPQPLPGLPKVNISSNIQAYNREPQLISCSAWSEIPFRLQLSRGRRKLREEQLFR